MGVLVLEYLTKIPEMLYSIIVCYDLSKDVQMNQMKTKRKASKWKDEMLFIVLDLARDGHSESQMARALGISRPTFLLWEQKRRLFCMAIEWGRQYYRNRRKKTPCLSDHIYQHLPSHLKTLWNRINSMDKARVGADKIDAILQERGKLVRQHLFLHALYNGGFSIIEACRKVAISRSTFDYWCKDPEFLELVNTVESIKDDFFESSLVRLIQMGDSPATCLAAKMRLRGRGYQEKATVDVNVKGRIDHNMCVLQIAETALPLKLQREILRYMRSAKQIESEVINASA